MRAVAISTLLVLFGFAGAAISPNFRNFIESHISLDAAKDVARDDLGKQGSFGGGNHQAGQTTQKHPVVFVHGYMPTSGSAAKIAKDFRDQFGYSEAETYWTRYGSRIPLTYKTIQNGMPCEDVKRTRNLLIAVVDYTNKTADVTGYSMGGPLARKAILGGRCVDTGEDLGEPLTNRVRTFLSVGGAQQGAMQCAPGFVWGVCNTQTGLGCGSRFLKDINSKKGYEGQNVRILHSRTDEVVGMVACLLPPRFPGTVEGAQSTMINFKTHWGVCNNTAKLQHQILNNVTTVEPPQPTQQRKKPAYRLPKRHYPPRPQPPRPQAPPPVPFEQPKSSVGLA